MLEFKTNLENLTAEEFKKYIDFVEEKVGVLNDVIGILIEDAGNNEVNISWKVKDTQKFERVARITGYLTGTTDRWNDAKRAELKERVKHG